MSPVRPMTKAETETMEEKDRLESNRCLQELEVLVELFDNDLSTMFELRRQIEKGTLRDIRFSDLWHLFRHGDDIRESEEHSQVYRILSVCGGRSFLSTKADIDEGNDKIYAKDSFPFIVICYHYSADGNGLRAVQKAFEIKKYDDTRLISSLPVFPTKFEHMKGTTFRYADFVARGKRYMDLIRKDVKATHKIYNGLTFEIDQLREEVDSEVIVDVEMALLKNPSFKPNFDLTISDFPDPRETLEFLDPECRREGCHENTAIYKDYEMDHKSKEAVVKAFRADWEPGESEDVMQEADLVICPKSVYGYVLRSRKWVNLDVSLLEDINVHSGGFDSLELPKGHKETLLALVETHSRGGRVDTNQVPGKRQIDLVRGKGKGLIILLHGKPGVGKTSTAECVAEHTGRPLFQVTCGDIGESAEVVERTLENHFQLAHRWGCVLLLDEADVFLMSRDKRDLKRNAVVSVFLRVLEYYSGILFLTTNRIGVFDQAFRSRIHMSFYYPQLDKTSTAKVWEMNLERIAQQSGSSMNIADEEKVRILKYAKVHFQELEALKTTWNGRQIRNAFQTAVALAEYDAHKVQRDYKLPDRPTPALKVEQFEKVAEASKQFDQYLKETYGGSTEADMAREKNERADLDDDTE